MTAHRSSRLVLIAALWLGLAHTALAANFNTLNLIREGERIRSAEPQTPLTSTGERLGRSGVAGKQRINLREREIALCSSSNPWPTTSDAGSPADWRAEGMWRDRTERGLGVHLSATP